MADGENHPMYPQLNTIPLGLARPKAKPAHAKLPKHIGVVIGGQNHWSRTRSVPSGVAATAGVQRALETLDFCVQRRIAHLTLYVFPDNIHTAAGDSGANVLALFLRHMKTVLRTLRSWRVRLRIAGDLASLPATLRQLIREAESLTCRNTGLTLTLSINGARPWDMTKAFKTWQSSQAAGVAHDPRSDNLKPFMLQAQIADPDLVVRTGGNIPSEHSMVWETRQTSLYFTDTPWPDFDTQALARALEWFAQDDRPSGIQVGAQS